MLAPVEYTRGMPKPRAFVSLLALLAFLVSTSLAGTPEQARFREYKFGMFIHWGAYSLASVEASWPIMRPDPKRWGPITESEYRRLPERFNPVRFDPGGWIRLAREAGQRYMVITS